MILEKYHLLPGQEPWSRLPKGDGYHPIKEYFQPAKTLVSATK